MRRSAWAAAFLLLAHLGLGLRCLNELSATFDEPALIGAGLSYWKTGDLRLDPDHPPLSLLWVSLPLVFQKTALPLDAREWRGGFLTAFGERLLFWSGHDAAALLFSARMMNLLLSLLLGWLLWRAARRRWGEGAGLAALACFAFSPSVLAHATLATTDFPAAFAVTLSVLAFARFLERPDAASARLAGGAALLAFLCKYPAALVWPAFALCLRGRKSARLLALHGFLPFAAAAGLLLCLPQVRFGFLAALKAAAGGHPAFLLGEVLPQGSRLYYAVAVLAKSTLPELLVLAGALALAARRRALAPELAVAALFFLAATLSRKQTGLRYVLPLYPLLALSAAPLASALLKRAKGGLALAGLCAWQAAAAFAAAPDFLPYFNEAAGGSARGHRLLVDSNLDWGQDLKRLGAFVRAEGSPEVILSYFGTDSPERFGLRPQHIHSHNAVQRRHANSEEPQRELLVVSVTNLKGLYLPKPNPFDWLSRREPLARVGYSLYVFDLSDAEAHRRLAEAYRRAGDGALAAREERRASRITRREGAGGARVPRLH